MYIDIIEHQKIINLLEKTTNQRSKIRIKILIQVIDDSRGTYTQIVRSSSKLQCWSQISVITVINVYLWKEI